MRKAVLLLVCCLFVSLNVFGQANEISEKEYFAAYRKAYDKFESTPVRRRVSKTISFEGGKATGSTETIIENVGPDRYRYAVTGTFGDKRTKPTLLKSAKGFIAEKTRARGNRTKIAIRIPVCTGSQTSLASGFHSKR